MWIFTRYGFYSVAIGQDAGSVMVRARDAMHLTNLQERFPTLAKSEVIRSPERDYGYRIVLPKADWADILRELAMEQTWSNFKSQAEMFQGPSGSAYLKALHDVWQRMAKLQQASTRKLMPSTDRDAMSRLTDAVRKIEREKRAEIEKRKRRAADFDAPDFIWEALLLSMATMGNSRGVQLIRKQELHQQVQWQALARLNPRARGIQIRDALKAAGVRMALKKAQWLDENFERIRADGGPEAVKRELEQQPGRDGKIAFLKTFRGIGSKYARNMMMDAYHPDFRESIAVDQRIQNISDALGVKFPTYQDAEQFYLNVAHAAGLSGWVLDRLLYNFTKDVLTALSAKSRAASAGR